jgi:hypothetical protein
MALGPLATLSIHASTWIPLDLYIQKHVSYRNTQRDPGACTISGQKTIASLFLDCFRGLIKQTEYWNKWIVDDCWIDLINERYEVLEALKFTATQLSRGALLEMQVLQLRVSAKSRVDTCRRSKLRRIKTLTNNMV